MAHRAAPILTWLISSAARSPSPRPPPTRSSEAAYRRPRACDARMRLEQALPPGVDTEDDLQRVRALLAG